MRACNETQESFVDFCPNALKSAIVALDKIYIVSILLLNEDCAIQHQAKYQKQQGRSSQFRSTYVSNSRDLIKLPFAWTQINHRCAVSTPWVDDTLADFVHQTAPIAVCRQYPRICFHGH
jgi:hypothetical protein